MIYADENVWIPVVEGLRHRGWTVHTARTEGLLGEPDERHLEYAASRGLTILTFDDDFLALVEKRGDSFEHPGVIFAPSGATRSVTSSDGPIGCCEKRACRTWRTESTSRESGQCRQNGE